MLKKRQFLQQMDWENWISEHRRLKLTSISHPVKKLTQNGLKIHEDAEESNYSLLVGM
jgi:hypothetical protein